MRQHFLAAAAAALVLQACASQRSAPTADPRCEQLDCAKMAQVNEDAKRRGHLLIWVNPPRKPPAEEAASD